jgi:hypothetical protein
MNITLSDRHRHSGGSGDGNRINYNDLLNKPNTLFISGGEFAENNGGSSYEAYNQFGCFEFADSASTTAAITFQIPVSFNNLVSMKVIYYNDNNTSVLRLRFRSSRATLDEAVTEDISHSSASFTTGAITNNIAAITVPDAAYDAIGATKVGDFIGLEINRDGGSGSDTYNNDLRVLGVLVEFSK